jgi:hypothetical protein
MINPDLVLGFGIVAATLSLFIAWLDRRAPRRPRRHRHA